MAIAASLTKPWSWRELVVAGGDVAELLELLKKRSMMLRSVELGVIGTLERAVPLWRNDRLSAAFSDLPHKRSAS